MRVEKKVPIVNKLGLHARAATQLVKLAEQFDAEITLKLGDKEANANSVLGIMMLEGNQGKVIDICTTGPDAQAALDAVEQLIVEKFHEQE